MKPPLPADDERWSLFLDVDGTLADLAPHPDDVCLSPLSLAVLSRLEGLLDGALAVVSGRSIDSIDALLDPLEPMAAGLHGLERRNAWQHTFVDAAPLESTFKDLERFVEQHPGLMLENKGPAIALHFRHAPNLESLCRDRTHALAAEVPGHHVIAGKMVFEIKPRSTNKGTAIGEFLEEHPFRGRIPVFAGDDVTDEDGFVAVNVHGGISIKVGPGASAAQFRLPDVAAMHAWLAELDARLADNASVRTTP